MVPLFYASKRGDEWSIRLGSLHTLPLPNLSNNRVSFRYRRLIRHGVSLIGIRSCSSLYFTSNNLNTHSLKIINLYSFFRCRSVVRFAVDQGRNYHISHSRNIETGVIEISAKASRGIHQGYGGKNRCPGSIFFSNSFNETGMLSSKYLTFNCWILDTIYL